MTFSVYSRRWGHNDNYDVDKTRTGWRITHLSIGGNADNAAKPVLYEVLNHDDINYPEALPGYFEWLWVESAGWNGIQIQEQLDVLAEWVNTVEKSSPGGFFSTYK